MAETNEKEINEILESLSPIERKVVPHLKEKRVETLIEKTGLDYTSVMRALDFLSNKGLVKLESSQLKIADLGVNGILYRQKGLPERRLINILVEKINLSLKDAQKLAKLSDNEFKAAIGALKKKALVNLINGKLMLAGKKPEISKKSFEEQILEILPANFEELKPEQKFALEQLKNRKDIIEIINKTETKFTLTELGKKLSEKDIKETSDLIEVLTPELLNSGAWRGKKFRRYDVISQLPEINGGKRHFVNQATDYARKIWTELGFKEMTGSMVQTGFWNFDALFTAQDHPVREIQDTFYIKDLKGKMPENKKLIEEVRDSHEGKIERSKGWGYVWTEEEAKKVLLRTHTTCLSAHTLATLKNLKDSKEKAGKFFAVGKCFRNETVDWSHGFEFNQTEGIVVDKNANFRHLLGYLKEFYRKMGFEEVKFVPSYFPYTEPSVEIYAYNSIKKVWIEVGGAGIFRPEVVIPLLGEYIPVLAWGPGFDRTLMEYYGISDLRQLYKNDLRLLRKMKIWRKS